MPRGIYDHSHIIPWNKGLTGAVIVSESTRAKLREKRKGKTPTFGMKFGEETRQKHREAVKRLGLKPPSMVGRKHTEEARKNMSAAQRKSGYMQYARGAMAPNWKGGIASKNHVARTSKAFIVWRESVFTRDNWTCQKCGARGVHLHPHHIKEFSRCPELRFEVDNGLTLCKECHLGLHGLLPKTAQTPAT